MATKTKDTKEEEIPATTALETQPTGAAALMALGEIEGTLERPADIDPNNLEGTEGITSADIRLPRLAIAQGTSDEMLPDNSKYIPDLKLFQMFNNVTGEIYGNGPLTLIPVKREVHWVEYDPDNRGVPLDMNVPIGDPRTKWTKNEAGESVPPLATEYVEFTCLLLRPGKLPEPIIVSIKTTNKWMRRAADQWTTFIGLRAAAIYRGMYKVISKSEKNDEGTFGVFVVKNAGFIPTGTPGGDALLKVAKDFFDQIKAAEALGGTVAPTSRESGGADDFDPAALERESQASQSHKEM